MNTTLYVEGRHLYDPLGEQVILRGVNKMSVYQDDPRARLSVFPQIRKTGANAVRIVWGTETLPDSNGNGTPANLNAVIQRCRDNHMIPMVELHDATGVWSKLS